MTALRVLWITPELPFWPGGSGGSTRQHKLIAHLVARGHAVDVVAPIHPDQQAGAELLRATGATLHGRLRPPSRVREVMGAVRSRPAIAIDALRLPLVAWQTEVFWVELWETARRLLDDPDTRPDVILIEHDWAARWLRGLVDPQVHGRIPAVSGLENLTWIMHGLQAKAATRRAMKLHHALEARRFARFARRELPRFDLLLTMSDEDRERLLQFLPGASAAVVPNGVDIGDVEPTPLPAAPVALFSGTFGYGPNAEGLEWLLRHVWPRVTERVPEARLLVVGRGVPDRLAALAGPEVQITGWVDQMQPWFDQARLVLVPIRSGGGTRLKVLDALASGRPIVSTPIGADGIRLRHGEHALIADDPDAFAAATVRLLQDAPLSSQLGHAGRELAESTYDWRMIGDRLADQLEALSLRCQPWSSGRNAAANETAAPSTSSVRKPV
jgi:glycosyltransferase involved in cell wall biosynthesis